MISLAVFFMVLSVLLSTLRNIFSKKLSEASFGSRRFFYLQSVLFFSGGFLLLFFSFRSEPFLSPLTLVYALCYGLLLILAQWLYTMAMKQGNVGVCSTVYYFGFVFPTLAGFLWWKDTLKVTGAVGILLVLVSILLSGFDSKSNQNSVDKKSYLFPLILAMISSGGLGLMQKIQQASPFPHERIPFVAVAFLFAGIISMSMALFQPNRQTNSSKGSLLFAILTGVVFSGSNLLNTTLAGMMPLTIFPPILNIGTIIASSVIGTILFREKPSNIESVVLVLGILAILLIGL